MTSVTPTWLSLSSLLQTHRSRISVGTKTILKQLKTINVRLKNKQIYKNIYLSFVHSINAEAVQVTVRCIFVKHDVVNFAAILRITTALQMNCHSVHVESWWVELLWWHQGRSHCDTCLWVLISSRRPLRRNLEARWRCQQAAVNDCIRQADRTHNTHHWNFSIRITNIATINHELKLPHVAKTRNIKRRS